MISPGSTQNRTGGRPTAGDRGRTRIVLTERRSATSPVRRRKLSWTSRGRGRTWRLSRIRITGFDVDCGRRRPCFECSRAGGRPRLARELPSGVGVGGGGGGATTRRFAEPRTALPDGARRGSGSGRPSAPRREKQALVLRRARAPVLPRRSSPTDRRTGRWSGASAVRGGVAQGGLTVRCRCRAARGQLGVARKAFRAVGFRHARPRVDHRP